MRVIKMFGKEIYDYLSENKGNIVDDEKLFELELLNHKLCQRLNTRDIESSMLDYFKTKEGKEVFKDYIRKVKIINYSPILYPDNDIDLVIEELESWYMGVVLYRLRKECFYKNVFYNDALSEDGRVRISYTLFKIDNNYILLTTSQSEDTEDTITNMGKELISNGSKTYLEFIENVRYYCTETGSVLQLN